jgi:ATP-dependent helicase/nuclease subunit A
MPRATYAKVDPVLRDVLEARETEVCYENLCLLYVAMTRAKRALYLICDPVGASSESNNYSRLLRETLAEGQPKALGVQTEDGPKTIGHRLYSGGPRDWLEHFAPDDEAERSLRSYVPTEPITLREAALPTLTRRRPSQGRRGEDSPVMATGWELLTERAGNALDYGALVHTLFESIEWLEDLGDDWEDALPKHWDEKVPIVDPGTRAKIHAEVLACLKQPDIHQFFSRDTQGGEKARVWREKAFDVVLDGEWVSGIFDRVIFAADGTTAILDFKSNRLAGADEDRIQDAALAYAGQISDYRTAMTLLADHVPSTKINVFLLFTDVRRLIEP